MDATTERRDYLIRQIELCTDLNQLIQVVRFSSFPQSLGKTYGDLADLWADSMPEISAVLRAAQKRFYEIESNKNPLGYR